MPRRSSGRPLAIALMTLALWAVAGPAVAATLPPLPKVPLHTEVTVEVNKRGQVVRITSTKPCKISTFNVQTFGNALQMWIRKPDDTATVGTFRVTFDYDPKTKKVARNIAIVSAGGTWGDEPGAATAMYEEAQRQLQAAIKKQQEQNAALPSLNDIRGKSPAPSASPR